MKKISKILFAGLAMICLVGLLYAVAHPFQETEHTAKKERIFRSAEYCQQCHPKEYDQWSRSAHSSSFSSLVFQKFFNQFLNDTDAKNKRVCLRCHAPAAVFNEDLEMKIPENNSPVSCEICHSITGYDSKYELLFDMTGNMFSTNNATLGMGHNVLKNPRINKTEWCAPCHTLVNPNQANIICSQDIRYDNWKENTGRPEQCQDCHMRDGQGNVDHSFRGISNPTFLKNALKIRWDVSIEPENYKVKLIIYNDKIAHLFPSGMSLTRVVVEAAIVNSESETLYKQEAFLGRLYEDQDGLWPVAGWKGSKIRIDNAISPLESRMMVFNLPVVADADSVVLKVYYSRYPEDKEQLIIFNDQKKL
jgi:hypothetical protein